MPPPEKKPDSSTAELANMIGRVEAKVDNVGGQVSSLAHSYKTLSDEFQRLDKRQKVTDEIATRALDVATEARRAQSESKHELETFQTAMASRFSESQASVVRRIDEQDTKITKRLDDQDTTSGKRLDAQDVTLAEVLKATIRVDERSKLDVETRTKQRERMGMYLKVGAFVAGAIGSVAGGPTLLEKILSLFH